MSILLEVVTLSIRASLPDSRSARMIDWRIDMRIFLVTALENRWEQRRSLLSTDTQRVSLRAGYQFSGSFDFTAALGTTGAGAG